MKTRPMTATKFRSVQVPRSQNGWMAQNYSPGKNNIMSARNSARQFNPQEGRITQRGYHGQNKYDKHIEKKLDFGNAETQAGFTARNSDVFKQAKLPKEHKEQQSNSYGRKLQYPYSKPTNIRPHTAGGEKYGQKRSQSVDFTSRHFVDKAVNSRKIVQDKASFDQKFQKAFEYLIKNNKAYLKEHSRICNQRSRPNEQIFKINLAPTLNTYREDYTPKEAIYESYMEPQNQKFSFSLPDGKFDAHTTNRDFHNGRQGPRAELQSWPESFKLQGPLNSTTTYSNHFPHNGNFQKMLPIASFNQHVRGMPHTTNSTNRSHYKGQPGKRSSQVRWNNMHPYGNDFDPNRGTQYQNQHGYKEQQPIQNWAISDPKLIKSDGKYNTQYRDNMQDKTYAETNQPNYCGCDRKTLINKIH